MGKLDEAEAKVNLALQQNPENTAAIYYKNLIKERKSGAGGRPTPWN